MADRLTTAFLRQVYNDAVRHSEMQHRLTQAMRDRYGVTHSDVDCDTLIDALDLGAGYSVTLKEADEAMAACGVVPLRGTAA